MINTPSEDFLRRLSSSIIYNPTSTPLKMPISIDPDNEEWVYIGNFKINIESVTKHELISMRKYLPQ